MLTYNLGNLIPNYYSMYLQIFAIQIDSYKGHTNQSTACKVTSLLLNFRLHRRSYIYTPQPGEINFKSYFL